MQSKIILNATGRCSNLVKVLTGSQYHEILDVHIIGGGASEMVYGVAAFIGMEMRAEDIKEIVFPHPIISEAIKETICQIK